MFEIEGTKHEKALIVVLAYIIGVTSGFLAFGPYSGSAEAQKHKIYNTDYSAEEVYDEDLDGSIIYQEEEEVVNSNGEVLGEIAVSEDFVYYTEDKLFVEAPTGRVLLSIHESELNGEISSDFSEQGLHVAPPVFVASDDERHVFFCESHDDSGVCKAFLYDVTENVIRPVAVNGQHLTLTETEVATARFEGNIFTVANLVSLPSRPWTLSLAQ